MSTKIEIPVSKVKTALPLIILLTLLISGLYATQYPEQLVTKTSKYNSPDSIRTIGFIAAGIGFFLMILVGRKLFSKKPGLIIDENGITDISNATYPELVEWNDITGVKKVKNGPIKSVVVMVDKPEKYINKGKKVMRPHMSKAFKFHGSPILIAPSRLKIKYDDLVDLITTEFEKMNRATSQD